MAQLLAARRAMPLTPEEMESLFPSQEYKSLEKEKEACSICLDDFEETARVRLLVCSHIFHVKCIDVWAQTNAKCPLCKKNLKEEEPQAEPPHSTSALQVADGGNSEEPAQEPVDFSQDLPAGDNSNQESKPEEPRINH